MKHIYSFLAVLFCMNMGATAQTLLDEDFETGTTTSVDPNFPDGWSVENSYLGNEDSYRWHVYYSSRGTITGTCVAACDATMSYSSEPDAQGPKEEILLTPDLTLDNTYKLAFDWKAASASALNDGEYDLQVRVVIDGNLENAETIWSFQDPEILKESGVTTFPWIGWQVYHSEIDLSKWQGKTVKLAFVHKMLKATANIAYIDNVKVTQHTPATAPKAQCTPLVYNFGEVYIGAKEYSEEFVLKNTGTNGLKITEVVSDNPDFSTTIVPADVDLEKNDTYSFFAVYQPTLTNAPKATVTVKTNGGDVKLTLAGTKKALPEGAVFEGFEGDIFPPVGWTANGWSQTGYALSGDFSAYSSGSLGEASVLMSPRLDLSTGTHSVSFKCYEEFNPETEVTAADNTVTLQFSTDGGSTWTTLFTNEEYNTILSKEISLGAPASDNCYLKWEYSAITMDSETTPELSIFFLDNVILPPLYGSKDKPTATTVVTPADAAVNVFNKEIELKWNPTQFADGYKLYVGTTSAANELVNGQDMGNATSYVISRCEYETTYYWKVVPYNGKGDATNVPTWSFTTIADQTVTEFPYAEGFEGEVYPPLGWRSVEDGYAAWETVNINPFDGKISAVASGNTENGVILETPEFVIPSDEDLVLGFYWGNSMPVNLKKDESGTLENPTKAADGIDAGYLDIYADGEWKEVRIISYKEEDNNYWYRERVDLSAYKGKTIAFRWRYEMQDWMKSTGVALDNITITSSAADAVSFNAVEWNAGKVNYQSSVKSSHVLTMLNDGTNNQVVKSVEFATPNFSTTLKAGDELNAGKGISFTLTFNAMETAAVVEDAMKVTFESGYSVEFPVKAEALAQDVRYYNFENETPGTKNPSGFTTIDVDRKATVNMAMLDYPAYGEAFAFCVQENKDWNNVFEPVSGEKVLVALGADAEGAAVDNWIISEKMTATSESNFRFYARNWESINSVLPWNKPFLEVLVSTKGNTDTADFETVMDSYELPYYDTVAYNEFNVDLSAYAGQDIYIALRHYGTDCLAAFFDDFYFEHFSNMSGVESVEAAGVSVYPNPATDVVYLKGVEAANVVVRNVAGAVVLTENDVNQVNVSALPAGMYILTAETAEGTFSTRIIKR